MIEPATYQPKRYGPYRDVIDDARFAAPGDPAAVPYQQGGDDAGDDEHRVRPDRQWAKTPYPLGRTGEGSDQSGHGSLCGAAATVDVSIRTDLLRYRHHSCSGSVGSARARAAYFVYYAE